MVGAFGLEEPIGSFENRMLPRGHGQLERCVHLMKEVRQVVADAPDFADGLLKGFELLPAVDGGFLVVEDRAGQDRSAGKVAIWIGKVLTFSVMCFIF